MFGRSGTIACLCFAALAMSFAPTDAIAQLFTPFCSANSDCGDGFICRKDFFFLGSASSNSGTQIAIARDRVVFVIPGFAGDPRADPAPDPAPELVLRQ